MFSDEAYVERMVDVEAALSRAQSRVGVIPPEIGKTLTEAMGKVTIE